jgi:diamine N-acetyltransferase
MSLHIRKATEKDMLSIRRICFEVWPQTYQNIISGAQIDYMLAMMYSTGAIQKQLKEDGCVFLVASKDGKDLGFASFSQTDEKQIFKLHKLYLSKKHQGLGLGKELLNEVLLRAKESGGLSIILQVNKYNNAKTFYLRNGFEVIQEAAFDIGNNFIMDDYVMSCKL